MPTTPLKLGVFTTALPELVRHELHRWQAILSAAWRDAWDTWDTRWSVEHNDDGTHKIPLGGGGGAPAAHATTHEVGGSDVVDITDLGGFSGSPATFLRGDGAFTPLPPTTPLAHHTTHETGGGDVVDLKLLGGYPGGTSTFLRADGTFAAPPAGGGGTTTVLTKYATNAQFVAPAAASPTSITPNATAWANSAWVEVITATATAIVLTGVQPVVFGDASSFEFDVGVGAAGSETVVTTVRGHVVSTSFLGRAALPLTIPTDNIAAASRVSVRLRKSSTSVTPWTVVFTYWQKPISGAVLTTAKPQKIAPAAANSITLPTTGTVWTNGAYATIIAATATAIVVTGIVFPNVSNGVIHEVDVAVGAAGAEVVITTLRIDNNGFTDAGFCHPLWNPLDVIPAGTRVSARVRKNVTTGGTPTLALVYVEKPL